MLYLSNTLKKIFIKSINQDILNKFTFTIQMSGTIGKVKNFNLTKLEWDILINRNILCIQHTRHKCTQQNVLFMLLEAKKVYLLMHTAHVKQKNYLYLFFNIMAAAFSILKNYLQHVNTDHLKTTNLPQSSFRLGKIRHCEWITFAWKIFKRSRLKNAPERKSVSNWLVIRWDIV